MAVDTRVGRLAAVDAGGMLRMFKLSDGALLFEFKGDPLRPLAIAKAEAALNYARACLEYRREEQREAEETVKREMTALESGQKLKTDNEKLVSDKTEPARQAVANRDTTAQAAKEAATALTAATDELNKARALVESARAAVGPAQAGLDAARGALEKDSQNPALIAARDAAEKKFNEAKMAVQQAEAAVPGKNEAFNQAQNKRQQTGSAAEEAAGKAKNAERELQEAKNMLMGAVNFIETATVVLQRAQAAVPKATEVVKAAETILATRETERKTLVETPPKPIPLSAVAFLAGGAQVAVAGDGAEVCLLDSERRPVARQARRPQRTAANVGGGRSRDNRRRRRPPDARLANQPALDVGTHDRWAGPSRSIGGSRVVVGFQP